MATEKSKIVQFFEGTGTDHAGRTIYDIFDFSHDELESTHDYIQWLFPLTEGSQYNPEAPILTEEDISLFHLNFEVENNFWYAVSKMLEFYGFGIGFIATSEIIYPTDDFDQRTRVYNGWISPGNHNYLRITRILKSMMLLGKGKTAKAWFKTLQIIYNESCYKADIGEETYNYWKNAVQESEK